MLSGLDMLGFEKISKHRIYANLTRGLKNQKLCYFLNLELG